MSGPLKRWRERQEPRVTQSAIAQATGIAQSLISKYEQEEARRVRPSRRNALTLERYTEALTPGAGVRVADWDGDDAERPPADNGGAAEMVR